MIVVVVNPIAPRIPGAEEVIVATVTEVVPKAAATLLKNQPFLNHP